MISMTMRRLRHAAIAAIAVAAAVPGGASATGVSWHLDACNGDATWNVAPLSHTASVTFDANATGCAGAVATADSDGNSHAGTLTWRNGSAWTQPLTFTPLVNTTSPVGAFSGVVTGVWDGFVGNGVITGVNGGAFEGEIVWRNGAEVSVNSFVGTVSCGDYCFQTKTVWVADPLRSI